MCRYGIDPARGLEPTPKAFTKAGLPLSFHLPDTPDAHLEICRNGPHAQVRTQTFSESFPSAHKHSACEEAERLSGCWVAGWLSGWVAGWRLAGWLDGLIIRIILELITRVRSNQAMHNSEHRRQRSGIWRAHPTFLQKVRLNQRLVRTPHL